jgi:hypothetical protein
MALLPGRKAESEFGIFTAEALTASCPNPCHDPSGAPGKRVRRLMVREY